MAFTVNYTISGGTPDYTVNLTGSGVPANIHSANGTYSFINVPAGSYDIDAVDSLGCVFPSIPVVLVASTTTTLAPSCALATFDIDTTPTVKLLSNGTITITNVATAVGNITYSIDSGQTFQSSNIFTGLAGGVYTVVVKDDVESGCTISGETRVFIQLVQPPYEIEFSPVREIAEGGFGSGTLFNPYDSGVIVSFSVEGNGGSGFTNPSDYIIAVEASIAHGNIGVMYIDHGMAIDGEIIFMELPRGRMTTSTEADNFDGGMGCLSTNHSMRFVNATFSGTVLITLRLYLEGVEVDSFGYYIDDGGGLPPLC